MKHKTEAKKEIVAPRETQVFIYPLLDSGDESNFVARQAIKATAETQGYEIGEFELISGFDVKNNAMVFNLVAAGIK